MKELLLDSYEQVEMMLKVYNVGSIICLLLDLICALAMLIVAGKDETKHVLLT